MSRLIEQKLADQLIASLDGLIEVRTGEQSATIPEDAMITVHLDSQTLRVPNITNLFDNRLQVVLRMQYADKTTAELDEAGKRIIETLTSVSLAQSMSAYHVGLSDTRASVGDGYWMREYNVDVLAVDNAS